MSRLTLHAVSKRFAALTAVAPLSLDFPAGSIHALLGENGAGKSTVVRMIAGVLRPDAGSIRIDGLPLAPGDPRGARAAGIGVVHQHFALIGALSVAENLLLGRTEDRRGIVRPTALVHEAEVLAAAHGLDIGDPSRACRTLPVGTLARIEILRALAGAPRVLLLDEPTAVLAPSEVADLFATLRRLRDTGMLILFVTHKLDEALRLCDAVTVLREGRVVAKHAVADVSASTLAAIMVGGQDTGQGPGHEPARTPTRTADRARTRRGSGPHNDAVTHSTRRAGAGQPTMDEREPDELDELDALDEPDVLEVRGLGTPPTAGRVTLTGIDLRLEAGEIRGVAGVDGNGQDELADALAGVDPRAGAVAVDGVPLLPDDVREAQDAGVLLIPSDRQRDGLALDLSVADNVLLAAPMLERFAPNGIIDEHQLHVFVERLVRDYRVTLTSVDQPVRTLSGGNQQRIVIGRTLALRPRVLIAVNPTHGLDIAATAQVHATLRRVAAGGTAVLLISTDLDELLTLATTVHVLFRGHLSAPVANAARAALGRLMTGLDA